jgi:hypothetical protein
MTTAHVFIATSLDGFIARPDGDIGWLLQRDDPAEDHGYMDFIADKDAIVMGRGTYEKVLTLGDWAYDRPVLVLSRQLAGKPVPAALEESPIREPFAEGYAGTPGGRGRTPGLCRWRAGCAVVPARRVDRRSGGYHGSVLIGAGRPLFGRCRATSIWPWYRAAASLGIGAVDVPGGLTRERVRRAAGPPSARFVVANPPSRCVSVVWERHHRCL